MSKKVLVPVADGTEEMEAVTIIDCLRRADADVTVASVDRSQITASRGVRLVADAHISDCLRQTYDLIVLPGGLPGAEHLRDCADLAELLKQQARAGRLYAAICASPAVVLQHHGLLENHKATCYPAMASDIRNWQDKKVLLDGNCITSQGPATALPFALKLIEILFDKKKADEVASSMLAKRP